MDHIRDEYDGSSECEEGMKSVGDIVVSMKKGRDNSGSELQFQFRVAMELGVKNAV